MRIPLTKYGLPQVAVYPAGIVVLMAAVGWLGPGFVPAWAAILAEGVLALVLVWAVMFFRDPHRQPPQDDSLWLAPADGTIMDIERVDGPAVAHRGEGVSPSSGTGIPSANSGQASPVDAPVHGRDAHATRGQDTLATEFIGGPALRIGIFLSIFNTHINRAPCDAKVEKITYRKGKFLNAMNPLAGKINESNDLAMVRVPSRDARISNLASRISQESDSPAQQRDTNNEIRDTRFVVRQVSGAIARRIVCATREGQQLAQGQRFGMIKFGSRTELYVPANENIECVVRIGDKVKAGITPVARYRSG